MKNDTSKEERILTRKKLQCTEYHIKKIQKLRVCGIWTRTTPPHLASSVTWRLQFIQGQPRTQGFSSPTLPPSQSSCGAFFPGEAGHWHLSSSPHLLISEAKSQISMVKRWGFSFSVQTPQSCSGGSALDMECWEPGDPAYFCPSSCEAIRPPHHTYNLVYRNSRNSYKIHKKTMIAFKPSKHSSNIMKK